MNCAICLYVSGNPRRKAVTVLEGYAVCADHLGYVAQGSRWAAIYYDATKAARPRQDSNLRPPT